MTGKRMIKEIVLGVLIGFILWALMFTIPKIFEPAPPVVGYFPPKTVVMRYGAGYRDEETKAYFRLVSFIVIPYNETESVAQLRLYVYTGFSYESVRLRSQKFNGTHYYFGNVTMFPPSNPDATLRIIDVWANNENASFTYIMFYFKEPN